MQNIQAIEKIEEMLQLLLSQQQRLSANGIPAHVIAGAILAFGIDRFGTVMGEHCTANVLEEAASDMRARSSALH